MIHEEVDCQMTEAALQRLHSVEVAEPVNASTREQLLAVFRARRS
jgi:hypothetical protein